MNPTQVEEKTKNNVNKRRKKHAKRSKLELWLDDLRCKLTVRNWHRNVKKNNTRKKITSIVNKIPYAANIGSTLYLVGFWVEYMLVCTGRAAKKVASAIMQNVGVLLIMILRPFVFGITTLCEDITEPFVRIFSGIRHIRAMGSAHPEESARQIRSEKIKYLRSGLHRYFPLLWNAVVYVLPIAAAIGLFYVVRTELGYHYILDVQVNGKSVGFVESEQVFESAREDVQSRINNARDVLEASGDTDSTKKWDISPTYTLAISGNTMTEGEVANAILQASSDEIGEGTAVYVDGALRFVTTQGDHLRTYLENVKAPYENELDPDVRVSFVHDIQLTDGVYLLSSIVPYDTVISSLNSDSEVQKYTAVAGDTVQSIVDATGVAFDSLAALNTDFASTDQTVDEGREVIIGVHSPELLKVKVVVRQINPVETQYETQTTESDEYDFGKTVVVQDGEMGLQEMTQDTTYIDGVVTSIDTVNVTTVKEPVTEQIVKGTKLKSGMIASTGSGNFMWPVPGYRYVSRWMSSYHKGADICAAAGTPIIASDSGVVTTATYHYSYGNYVEIDHGNGYSTLYAHMISTPAVSVGQAVKQGQVIGYVGSTGDSTGNHCHFEMYYNGVRFSAQNLFPGM